MQLEWRVEYSDTALKSLKKLSRKNPQLIDEIMDYLDEVAALGDPFARGKALKSNLAGRWCYRVKDYWIICQIDNGLLLITALNVGHRSTIYE